MSVRHNLLLEIGSEEIPAGYIKPALKSLSLMILQRMDDVRIEHGEVRIFGTPRRLAVEVADVAVKQKQLSTETTGPPEKVGFDENGAPTLAAKKFAEKSGVFVNDLTIKDTKKGRYLCARKTERGLATSTLLKKILPDVILSIPFPKTMKWANLNIEFARPIHSILALFGDKIIPFVLGNVKSGRHVFGHSFMNPGRIMLSNSDEYVEALRLADVLVDLKERKKQIVCGINKIAGDQGGRILQDDDLVDIVTNLVEYPAIISGKFDKAFLELPPEVLITAMREHQKYFAVIDEKNNLMPFFIAVNNTGVKDVALVARGHERVLRARLKDAQFFCRSDLEKSLDDLAGELKGVLFQARLGSVYEKAIRVQKLSTFLTDAADFSPDVKKDVSRAAFLCKADLVSQIVIEFPKLQGVMGRVYAAAAGESDTVASAIEEHYRPAYSGGPLPVTDAGAVLGIADKIDTICGCFSIDLIPTGTADPYALRRQGIGVIQIMLDKGFSFSLSGMIAKSLELFVDGSARDIKEKKEMIYAFLQSRIANLLFEEGFSKDVIAAVIAVSIDHIPNVWNRVRALEQLKTESGFEHLATVFKRVVNIIKKAGHFETKEVNEDLFQDECERVLFSACNEVKKKVTDSLEKGFFDQAMLYIASLRDPVDAFFDGVMVMAEDVRIRNNRLALLKHIADLFGLFADFSKIST
ncbi:MAG: glycine--tRNA ligase subunit beta [Deltaproteobacteria bacterium]|nr:glycine--tRNA ligase subunit beta [Deltaproteobacteria bacterium]MBW2661749.1 glycine--tRNA ligase subunit beta [Deltaproteobacteria bacterium]